MFMLMNFLCYQEYQDGIKLITRMTIRGLSPHTFDGLANLMLLGPYLAIFAPQG